MKKTIVLALVLLSSVALKAQSPITWTFSATKVADKKYEIHMTAAIQPGWHLFSQTQPEDAIAIPTGFTINPNPLLAMDGKIKEVGKVEKFHDAKLEISASQYSNKVDFVQVVKLKAKAKTNVTGIVEFQTCNDEKCLPPKKLNFSVALN
ncbi:MAG: protein-disulfide reductase DsbD domain-containing protein [Chitinophagaceae bacterium]